MIGWYGQPTRWIDELDKPTKNSLRWQLIVGTQESTQCIWYYWIDSETKVVNVISDGSDIEPQRACTNLRCFVEALSAIMRWPIDIQVKNHWSRKKAMAEILKTLREIDPESVENVSVARFLAKWILEQGLLGTTDLRKSRSRF